MNEVMKRNGIRPGLKKIASGQTWSVVENGLIREFEVKRLRKNGNGITMVHGQDDEGEVSFPYEDMRDDLARFHFCRTKIIRAMRFEIVKPTNMPWDVAGLLLRQLASVTPILLNAAYDALVAMQLVGSQAVKAVVAPNARAATPDGIAYQAVLKKIEELRTWKPKEGRNQFRDIHVAGGTVSAISRAASQARSHREQGRVSFESKRILIRRQETTFAHDNRGHILTIPIGGEEKTTFALAHQRGAKQSIARDIANGRVAHGDCKLTYDERRRKWYALLSYEAPAIEIPDLDPNRVIAVHRGVRNVFWLLSSDGNSKSIPGSKFIAQRLRLKARMRDMQRISVDELGRGAKGHGRKRRFENSDTIEGKLSRVTHTFCQQMASLVLRMAIAWGCGTVVIEDYGGIEPDEDQALRRVLDRFPLHEMKQCIISCLEPRSIALKETSSAFISTTCPRCNHCSPSNHNRRTGMFHCRVCIFERPADFVAAFWMLERSGSDITTWRERLRRERELADRIKHEEVAE